MKAIIFDFDGTLIDSVESIWNEYKRVEELMGLPPITYKDFASQSGRPWRDALLGLWPEIDIDKFNSLYRREMEKVSPVENMADTIKKLKSKYKIGLLTSRGGDSLMRHLKSIGLEPSMFDMVLHRDILENHKPNPKALHQALSELNLERDEVIYVGDSVIDLECAKNAGVDFVGVLTGGATRDDFEAAGAERIIDSVAELPDIL